MALPEEKHYQDFPEEEMGEHPIHLVPGLRQGQLPPEVKTLQQLRGFARREKEAFGQTISSLRQNGLDVAAKIHPGGKVTLFIGSAIGIGAIAGAVYLAKKRRKSAK